MKEFIKKTEDEETKHAAAIDRIAASLQVPREEVAPLYERVLVELQQNATIKTFLAIFAARRVEQLIRTMRGPFGPLPLGTHP
ncbi:MAG TPA: DUF3562 domain-containing protein [Syntrophorhabdales bacterium]|nr:DUF3562 domain-containing protein [Syntrophorhabdales bacterium]